MTIRYQEEYTRYIINQGVGENDKVASSPNSYISYLRSVSTHLNIEINETTLGSEDDVQRLATAIEEVRAPKTIKNYISAMRQYVAMIQSMTFTEEPENVDDEKHFRHSSFREKLLEHLFVAELLKRSWLEHSCDVEIAKPEVDSKGYDLIVEKGEVVRHIQLKSTKRGGNATAQNINVALATKPSGCVVWLEFDEETLAMGPFRFLGAEPGSKLPSIEHYTIAKHTKGNAEGKKALRPQLRRISKREFKLVSDFDELFEVLFG